MPAYLQHRTNSTKNGIFFTYIRRAYFHFTEGENETPKQTNK